MKRLLLLSSTLLLTCLFLCLSLVSTADAANFAFTVVSGANQTGYAGNRLLHGVRVKITRNGIPQNHWDINARPLHYGGGGSVDASQKRTGWDGTIDFRWTLGELLGTQQLRISINISGEGERVLIVDARAIKPVTQFYGRNPTGVANIWKKFRGDSGIAANVPELIDFSYAGYKNGREAIPDTYGYTVYDVTDYGAIPNDGLSDTTAIKNTVNAARNGHAIIHFPPGKYDVMMWGEDRGSIRIRSSFTVIRGTGSKGSDRGGTTIKIHGPVWGGVTHVCLFEVNEGADQWNGVAASDITGNHEKGSTYIDVKNGSKFMGKKYVQIWKENLTGADYDKLCARPLNQMTSAFTDIRNGIDIAEYHEIDRVVGNRIHLKAPIITHVNSSFALWERPLIEEVGFEDLHIDGGLNEPYIHLQQAGRGGMSFSHTAHSWVRRCRFTDTVNGVRMGDSYCPSTLSIIFDGRRGHYTAGIGYSTYGLMGFIEDNTDIGVSHGPSVSHLAAGCVVWFAGGINMNPPDSHSHQPRHTLVDNLYSHVAGTGHASGGGGQASHPNHLDGYVRWNNYINSSAQFKLWDVFLNNPSYWGISIVQGSVIGHRQISGTTPRDAHVEFFQGIASPNSLYHAQLLRRTDADTTWADAAKQMHEDHFRIIYSSSNNVPIFATKTPATLTVKDYAYRNHNIGEPFQGTDVDGDKIYYQIHGDDSAHFEIDLDTGQLKTKVAVINYATKSSYNFVVSVSDRKDETRQNLTITVIENNKPVFNDDTPTEFTLTNPVESGANVGEPFQGTDGDSDTVYYQIHDGDSEHFRMDLNTGQLTTHGVLVHPDTKAVYTFRVSISDYKQDSNMNFTVNVVVPGARLDDRSPEVAVAIRASLKLRGLNLEYVPVITIEHLERIIDLSLKRLTLISNTTLKNGDFANIPNLKKLWMERIALSELPEGIFNGLYNLKALTLHENGLEALPTGLFRDLGALDYVTLRENYISSLDANAFKGADSITHIDLNTNELRTLPATVFAHNPNLDTIILENNIFRTLPGNLFSENPNLHTIRLQDNQLRSLPDDFFKGLTKLYRLRLQGNKENPLPIEVELIKVAEGKIKIHMPTGAPSDQRIPITITNGNLEDNQRSITISVGKTDSKSYTVERTEGTTGRVTAEIGRLPIIPLFHTGYKFTKPRRGITAINKIKAKKPKSTLALKNFPNPFNPETWIPYQLAKPSNVSLTVYNIRGVVVREIVLGQQAAGFYTSKSRAIHWDGRNVTGERVGSGVYFYQFKTDSMSELKKMVIMK